MRRKQPLSSMTVGRCFVHDPTEADAGDSFAEPGSSSTALSRTVMAPATVWRVLGAGPDGVDCVNALGDRKLLDASLSVAEVPRGGYDRLVERVADPEDPLGGGA